MGVRLTRAAGAFTLCETMPPSSSGPGYQVLILKTGVRLPLGVVHQSSVFAGLFLYPERVARNAARNYPVSCYGEGWSKARSLRSSWNDTIVNRGRRPDGRWVDLEDRDHPWICEDERDALAEFYHRKAKRLGRELPFTKTTPVCPIIGIHSGTYSTPIWDNQ